MSRSPHEVIAETMNERDATRLSIVAYLREAELTFAHAHEKHIRTACPSDEDAALVYDHKTARLSAKVSLLRTLQTSIARGDDKVGA